jgi:hypothetical protein
MGVAGRQRGFTWEEKLGLSPSDAYSYDLIWYPSGFVGDHDRMTASGVEG